MQTADAGNVITGRKVLLAMVAFFGVIIAVNISLAVFALNSDNGLVVRNSYVASQDFNRMAEKARQQEMLGWRMSTRYDGAMLIVRLDNPDGINVEGAAITARVGRPVTDRQDRDVTPVLTPDGSYRAPLELGEGVWEAEVTATGAGGETYRKIFRFKVGAAG